jgi:hypothetical protein
LIAWQPTEQTAAGFAAVTQVSPKNGTDILTIAIETTNPQKSADIINQLMAEYGEMTKEDKSAEAALTLLFVDRSLKSVQHEIDSIQKEKTAFQKANNLVDLQGQTQNYLNNVSETDKSVKEQEILMKVTELVEGYLKDKQNNFKTVPSSLGLSDLTSVAKLRNTIRLNYTAPASYNLRYLPTTLLLRSKTKLSRNCGRIFSKQ